MIKITDIAKNTYKLTFDLDIDYDWLSVTKVLITSTNIVDSFASKELIYNEETEEKISYWQDLFFMELAEHENEVEVTADLLNTIKAHPLFIENKKFITQLPKTTTKLGRDLLIDSLIDTENADELIPDDVLVNVLKKKSREELREKFESWSEEKQPTKLKFGNILKYTIAACLVGVIVTIGYNNLFNNTYDFDNSPLLHTAEKIIIRDRGFGFADEEKKVAITVQTIDYNKAILSNKSDANKLLPNSYSFVANKLRLVLTEDANAIELLELKKNDFFIKIQNKFYKIEFTNKFKNLERLNDSLTIEKLEQILFENE